MMEIAVAIAIIIQSVATILLVLKNAVLSYKVGKYEEQLNQKGIPFEINRTREENTRLLRDIERILEGDQYVIDVHKERIKWHNKMQSDLRRFTK